MFVLFPCCVDMRPICAGFALSCALRALGLSVVVLFGIVVYVVNVCDRYDISMFVLVVLFVIIVVYVCWFWYAIVLAVLYVCSCCNCVVACCPCSLLLLPACDMCALFTMLRF